MKRHGLDPVSLVFGLLFLLVALVFAGGDRSAADVGPVWLWAVPALALGLLALMWGIARIARPAGGSEDPAGPGADD